VFIDLDAHFLFLPFIIDLVRSSQLWILLSLIGVLLEKQLTMELKEIQAQLKVLNDYFVGKICNGDYEITKRDKHTYNILIDGTFNFCLWVANADYAFRTYSDFQDDANLMRLNFTQKQKAWTKIKADKKKYIDEAKEREEREMLAKLQEKYKS